MCKKLAALAFAWWSLGATDMALAVVKGDGVLANPAIASFTVEVDGEARIVKAGTTIAIPSGDKFRVLSAEPVGRHERKMKPRINIMGFNGGEDDTGKWVTAGKGMAKQYSLAGKGQVFEIQAEWKNKVLGQMFVEIKEPELRYIILEINGKEQIVHPDGQLIVKKSDKIKVKRIATNIHENDLQATFKMRPLMGPHNVNGIDFYNLSVKRSGLDLAGVTLVVNH